MRIEAQGKYLQKIIEEQQKLGGVLKASESIPSAEDKKQELSESEIPADTSAGPSSSPGKGRRTDDGLPDGCTLSPVQPKADLENRLVGQWDQDLYENDALFGLNSERVKRKR